ncbi:hypothetical protein [Hymenobacter perfusus]|uniref:Uncharacterized protein n=1 Tax=Hymenobacter perfusus TaxID=1236770 RepID=A0A3R9MC16_9BACT|nr:hypothetical protein [Hymenobacter perfusus]RSK38418.1 hypothetical protein EI293_21610 [Hymenobacter perfusus]
MTKQTHIILLLTTHLLLAGGLLGAFLWAHLYGTEAQQFYVARVWVGLALLLLAWVGALLLQWLWQRRWIGAGVLAVLLVADGMALCVGIMLMGSFFMAYGPN